ncbi:OmpA family protein [Roseivivax sp. CAU 1753]
MGGTTLRADQSAILDELGAALESPDMQNAGVILVGHSSSEGVVETNFALSIGRAEAVAAYLRDTIGIAADRISIEPMGEAAPKSGERPESQLQRRVEIYLTTVIPMRIAQSSLLVPEALSLLRFEPSQPPRSAALPFGDGAKPAGLGMDKSGTLEFWVQPGWDVPDPDQDLSDAAPVVMSVHGLDGTRLSVQITQERDALVLWNGGYDVADQQVVGFDFTQDLPHHVAIAFANGAALVFINGQPLAELDWEPGAPNEQVLTLGRFPNEETALAFTGLIGGVRSWNRPLEPEEIRTAARSAGAVQVDSPLYPAFNGALTETIRGDLEYQALDTAIQIASGAWTTYGSDAIRIINRDEIARSKIFNDPARDPAVAAQLKSPHVDLLHDALPGPDTVFSSYPLFHILQEPALGFDLDFEPVPGEKGERIDHELPAGAKLRSMRVWYQRASIITIRMNYVQADGQEKAAWFGETDLDFLLDAESDLVLLRDGEFLIGLTGKADKSRGWIYELSVHTNQRVYGPYGAEPPRFFEPVPFSNFLPEGVPMSGMTARIDNGFLMAVGLTGDLDTDRASVVVTLEDGQVTRFRQTGRNTYRATHAAGGLSTSDLPELRILTPELIRIDGIDLDLVPVHPHEPPKGELSSFDNVFIAQAKAVNLRSNYRGYDITTMDPLHLTDTGTGKMVFALPDPASADYYDANRIFIPKGLLYVPEFTGEQHAETHVVTSMADYTKATSTNVSVTLGIPGASFSGSYSHKRASEKIRGRNNSLTLGLSKAYFYDLVLDKARMRLHPDFVTRVLRLKEAEDDRAFDAFVDIFGTHYPQAVIYGGMGVLEMAYSGNTIGRLVSDEVDIAGGAQGEVKGKGKAGFNVGSGTSSNDKFQQEMGNETENFYWVGGAHSGQGKESWGVGIDGVVPVHVSLRTLDELLLPPFFFDPVVNYELRRKVQAAIDRHIDAADRALAAETETMPRLYEVTLVKIRSSVRSAEADAVWEIGGKVMSGANGPPGSAIPAGSVRRLAQTDGARVFFDVARPERDQPAPNSTDLVSVDASSKQSYYVRDTDTGDAGALRQVYAVDPCAVELGGSLELFADFTEYDTEIVDPNESYRGGRLIEWRDFPATGSREITLSADSDLLSSGSPLCLVDKDEVFEIEECAMLAALQSETFLTELAEGILGLPSQCERVSAGPISVIAPGFDMDLDRRRALCDKVVQCIGAPNRDTPTCRKVSQQCLHAGEVAPSADCERAEVVFRIREIRDSFARPATRLNCTR